MTTFLIALNVFAAMTSLFTHYMDSTTAERSSVPITVVCAAEASARSLRHWAVYVSDMAECKDLLVNGHVCPG